MFDYIYEIKGEQNVTQAVDEKRLSRYPDFPYSKFPGKPASDWKCPGEHMNMDMSVYRADLSGAGDADNRLYLGAPLSFDLL